MPTKFAIEKAAQAWTAPATEKTVMDVQLAEVFANILDKEIERMKDEAEFLWIVLANVSGGDWKQQTPEWQEAAARARDKYHARCSEMNQLTA